MIGIASSGVSELAAHVRKVNETLLAAKIDTVYACVSVC